MAWHNTMAPCDCSGTATRRIAGRHQRTHFVSSEPNPLVISTSETLTRSAREIIFAIFVFASPKRGLSRTCMYLHVAPAVATKAVTKTKAG